MTLTAQMLNSTFREEWEFHPVDVEEIREIYDPLKAVADPDVLLFAEVDGKVAGFCQGSADFSRELQRAAGRLGPLAGIGFVLRARRAPPAGIYAIGVLPAYRGRGIGAALLAAALQRIGARSAAPVAYHLVNDDNHGSRRLAEAFGGVGRVLHHSLEKALP